MTKRSADAAYTREDSGLSSRLITVPNAPRLRPLQNAGWNIPFLDIGPAACPDHLAVREGGLPDNPSVLELFLRQWEVRAKRP